ncbi:hypothetical protein F2P45_25630 [Massilia sp. CCM 8733]|uniref:Uncharacterized protein n=1 Tax=Massilia mucilaginosa TaxID=2609282 RepID=A0ABX0NZM3_9BURK|nr:hypothetical protein [Massilia mucilaginosa]NHZ92362.1 hypothetical protein [Massilia mucilaginosa]
MTKKEQSVADTFHKFLKMKANRSSVEFVDFSLNGQDRDAAADYLFASGSRFTLVEYKHEETDISAEAAKWRRGNLCEFLELQKHRRRKKQHDQCHYIAWKAVDKDLRFNIYRHEVCNTSIFKSSTRLKCALPRTDTRITGTSFAENFLSGQQSIPIEEFEDYLEWLMKHASNAETSTVQLAAVNLNENIFSMEEFDSVRAAYEWMENQKAILQSKYGSSGPQATKAPPDQASGTDVDSAAMTSKKSKIK